MIVDTNILIDALRGKLEAKRFFLSAEQVFSISVVSISELYAGLRSSERQQVQVFLRSFTVHIVDEAIAKLAGEFKNQYSRSHNVGLADALLAATSQIHRDQLATLNTKHFPMLLDVIRPY